MVMPVRLKESVDCGHSRVPKGLPQQKYYERKSPISDLLKCIYGDQRVFMENSVNSNMCSYQFNMMVLFSKLVDSKGRVYSIG